MTIPTPHRGLLVAVVAGLCACGADTSAIKLVLTPEPLVNSLNDVATYARTLEVIVDAADGLDGVTSAGPTSGGGNALDLDHDGLLEVSFVSVNPEPESLPVLELGLSSNLGRSLAFSVYGYPNEATHVAAEAWAFGIVTAVGVQSETRAVGLPFNLRATARAPQVVMMVPADGEIAVPTNLAYITVVFSTQIAAASLAEQLQLVGDQSGLVSTRAELTDALFLDSDGTPATRSVLRLFVSLSDQGDRYTLNVGTGVTSATGRNLDQFPALPSAQPWVAHFNAPAVVNGPPDCTTCPAGYGCAEGVTGCAPLLTCAAGCQAGFVCDPLLIACVDDCRLFGACPSATFTCQTQGADAGLCR